jgi:hypothetical protein
MSDQPVAEASTYAGQHGSRPKPYSARPLGSALMFIKCDISGSHGGEYEEDSLL